MVTALVCMLVKPKTKEARNNVIETLIITAGIFGASEIQVTLIEQRGPISWNANWENVEQARDGHSCVRFKLFVCLMDLLMILLR